MIKKYNKNKEICEYFIISYQFGKRIVMVRTVTVTPLSVVFHRPTGPVRLGQVRLRGIPLLIADRCVLIRPMPSDSFEADPGVRCKVLSVLPPLVWLYLHPLNRRQIHVYLSAVRLRFCPGLRLFDQDESIRSHEAFDRIPAAGKSIVFS